ncbi:hypothetical protein FRC09_014506 [Ceratobasidium sp. 395]|nr:hypothetical protein FRC09_014506 [Ceratobasidium sp. 395]
MVGTLYSAYNEELEEYAVQQRIDTKDKGTVLEWPRLPIPSSSYRQEHDEEESEETVEEGGSEDDESDDGSEEDGDEEDDGSEVEEHEEDERQVGEEEDDEQGSEAQSESGSDWMNPRVNYTDSGDGRVGVIETDLPLRSYLPMPAGNLSILNMMIFLLIHLAVSDLLAVANNFVEGDGRKFLEMIARLHSNWMEKLTSGVTSQHELVNEAKGKSKNLSNGNSDQVRVMPFCFLPG